MWEKSGRLRLCAMKRTIFKHLISGFPEKENAKEYLVLIGERFQVSNNDESRCLMKQLTDMKYDNNWGVREFILKMVHVQNKMKSRDIDLNENFIVSHALKCLPAEFTQIKISYNTIGDKWTINNLITKCVAEEEKLEKEISDLALLTYSGKDYWKNKKNIHNASHRYHEFRKSGSQHHNIGGPKHVAFKKSFWYF